MEIYDRSRIQAARPTDTEDKDAWAQYSVLWEDRFRQICRLYHDFKLARGPDPYGPDFTIVSSGRPAELKHREEPFFMSEKLFGIPPRFAFTYNVRDHHRYKVKYPNLYIFVRTVWLIHNPRFDPVRFLDACGHGSLQYWDKVVKNAPIHHYGKRVDDPENKKRSYVLDIRDFPHLWWTDGRVYV